MSSLFLVHSVLKSRKVLPSAPSPALPFHLPYETKTKNPSSICLPVRPDARRDLRVHKRNLNLNPILWVRGRLLVEVLLTNVSVYPPKSECLRTRCTTIALSQTQPNSRLLNPRKSADITWQLLYLPQNNVDMRKQVVGECRVCLKVCIYDCITGCKAHAHLQNFRPSTESTSTVSVPAVSVAKIHTNWNLSVLRHSMDSKNG